MFITPDCVDADVATAPYVGVDELRTETDADTGVTVDYRSGTYFAVVRVTTQREGDPDAVYGLVPNLARVRVVVT